jgi:hypothetical protein
MCEKNSYYKWRNYLDISLPLDVDIKGILFKKYIMDENLYIINMVKKVVGKQFWNGSINNDGRFYSNDYRRYTFYDDSLKREQIAAIIFSELKPKQIKNLKLILRRWYGASAIKILPLKYTIQVLCLILFAEN